jgi:hypothetical protein
MVHSTSPVPATSTATWQSHSTQRTLIHTSAHQQSRSPWSFAFVKFIHAASESTKTTSTYYPTHGPWLPLFLPLSPRMRQWVPYIYISYRLVYIVRRPEESGLDKVNETVYRYIMNWIYQVSWVHWCMKRSLHGSLFLSFTRKNLLLVIIIFIYFLSAGLKPEGPFWKFHLQRHLEITRWELIHNSIC